MCKSWWQQRQQAMRQVQPRRATLWGWWGTSLIIAAIVVSSPARSQVMQVINGVPVAMDSDEEQQKPTGGFSVKKEDQKVIEQLEDFDRYRDKKAWDRAFKALSGVVDSGQTNGMAPTKDGFWIPTRQKILRSLVSMPQEGKDAYRLFNDAKAKQWLDQALAAEAAGEKDTLPQLKKGVEQFFITAVGDKLADRLGDALFEAGDYTGAARAWEQILIYCPETSLSPVRLQLKRATALLRSGRSEQFKQLAATIREKYAGETVKVAGRDVPIEEQLKALSQPTTKPATQPTTQPAPSLAEDTSPIALPSSDHPLWQCEFCYKELLDEIYTGLNQNGWGMQMSHMARAVPAAVTDGKRVFGNWYGVIWAIDAETGKLLWQTDHFKKIGPKFNEMVQWQLDANRFTVTIAADAQGNPMLVAVSLNIDKLQNQEPFRLISYDPATGKQKWTTASGPLSGWAFIGAPLIADGTIYAAAHPKENQEIHLLAVGLDGKLQWESLLGQPQVGNNWRGMPVYPLPMLKQSGGMLYIMTGNGALIAFDTVGRAIEWAFTYEKAFGQDQSGRFGFNPYNQTEPTEPAGASWLADGVLYFKDRGGKVMYALDLAGPSLKWLRPVGMEVTLAGFDDKHYYLLSTGQDNTSLAAVDWQTNTMVKSSKLPDGNDSIRPIGAGGSYFVFLSRGIFEVNTRESDVTRDTRTFRGEDRESLGGVLLRAGDKLITVSDRAITAYPVGRETHAER
jgi:outer membrane protein assembly factor BamB